MVKLSRSRYSENRVPTSYAYQVNVKVVSIEKTPKPKKKPYNPYGKEAKWLRQLSVTSKQMPYCME